MITEETACAGKVQYATRWAAKSSGKKLRSVRLSTYLCNFCGWWHNGRPIGWRSTKRGKKFIDRNTVLDLPDGFVDLNDLVER